MNKGFASYKIFNNFSSPIKIKLCTSLKDNLIGLIRIILNKSKISTGDKNYSAFILTEISFKSATIINPSKSDKCYWLLFF